MTEWRKLADRLTREKVPFVISPDIRFEGEPGEQATFFIRDPSGNALEFKAFDDESRIFAR
jgi:extradiol dioxygenase family protein